MSKKTTIIVNGRFHAFDYAAELQRRGALHKLISTMPRSRARKFNIAPGNYVGLPVFEAIKVVWRRVFRREPPTLWYARLFTRVALWFVPRDSEVIISFAGYSEEIFKAKKLRHALKVLDRSSTHTLANIALKQRAAEYHRLPWAPHPEKFIERELSEYALAHKILLPSTFVKQTFVDHGVSEEKVIQIPYAFSQKKFDPPSTRPSPKSKAVLFVGQLIPRKGVGVLIDAMHRVRQQYPDYTLWLVGALNPAFDPQGLRQDWITYHGILRGHDLFNVYSRASVFCLPSFEEGLAYVLTEANYFDLPIVATPNSGIEDVTRGDNEHFLAPAGDPVGLAEKIVEAIESTQRPGKGKANEKDASMPMTWERYCDQLLVTLDHA